MHVCVYTHTHTHIYIYIYIYIYICACVYTCVRIRMYIYIYIYIYICFHSFIHSFMYLFICLLGLCRLQLLGLALPKRSLRDGDRGFTSGFLSSICRDLLFLSLWGISQIISLFWHQCECL